MWNAKFVPSMFINIDQEINGGGFRAGCYLNGFLTVGGWPGDCLRIAYVLSEDCLAHMYPCRVPGASPDNTEAIRLPLPYH